MKLAVNVLGICSLRCTIATTYGTPKARAHADRLLNSQSPFASKPLKNMVGLKAKKTERGREKERGSKQYKICLKAQNCIPCRTNT